MRLRLLFASQVGKPIAAGYDRMGFRAFDKQLATAALQIHDHLLAARYRFTPFRERLLTKGAKQFPRQISVPTLRDRLLLSALKNYLHIVAPEAIPAKLPTEYVRDLKVFLGTAQDLPQLRALRFDIESFFASIQHNTLRSLLAQRVPCSTARSIIAAALRTPTLPSGTPRVIRKRSRNTIGVPQGLPVSNYLANLYLLALDQRLRPHCRFYVRYVDDILIIAAEAEVAGIRRELEDNLATLGLRLNDTKLDDQPAAGPYTFLGYEVHWPLLTVKAFNTQRFLASVSRLFATYRHRLASHDFPSWLTTAARQAAFVTELNERITGATSGRRRYGWVFYFVELTDIALLRRLDRIIAGMFERLPDFRGPAPARLKSLVRTFYEAKYSPEAGYIRDYNRIMSLPDKLTYLVSRGVVSHSQAKHLSEGEVETMFLSTRNRTLLDLDEDVGFIY